MQVVRELGYRPNRMAQAMNTQRSHMVGLVIPDITNPFFPEVARGVQDAAFEADYNVFLCNSNEAATSQISFMRNVEMSVYQSLVAQGVDGIVTFPQIDDAELRRFADSFRPIVLINRHLEHPNVDSMQADLSYGAQLATNHLIKSGHTRIGMVTNVLTSEDARRTRGFINTMQENHLPVDRIIAGEPTLAGGYQAVQQLLTDFPDTTALFTYNDMVGLGAIRACNDLGLDVPSDVSIIGFDDIELSSMYTPALSTVRINKYEMGRRALRRLVHLIDNPGSPLPQETIPVKLILRESSN